MALRIALFVKLVIISIKMGANLVRVLFHTVPLAIAVTLVIVVKADTIFLITFNVFSVTPL